MKQKYVLYFIGLFIYLFRITNAVPVLRHTRDVFMSNNSSPTNDECISEDVIYKAGDEVPSPGPCEQCVCDPPKVQCTMIKCKTNSGCKMIQRPNHCCPDFMCDCEYKGRVYNNGERLELEDTPCQVCYCKGGEIMCTSITCYERTDCQPKYVPGQCCPRYDHCPLETNEKNSTNATVIGSKREIQPWLMTNAVTVKPIKDLKHTTMKPQEEHTQPNVYPQTLKIHEVVPTTAKNDRFPNDKRPILSPVEKSHQEVDVNEKATSNIEMSTVPNGDITSTESDLISSTEDKVISSAEDAISSISTLIPLINISDESSSADARINDVESTTSINPSGNSESIAEFSSSNPVTATTESSLSYESISKEDLSAGDNETKGNSIEIGTAEIEDTTKGVDWEIASPQGSLDSSEIVSIREEVRENGFTNSIINDELAPTINSVTLSDEPVSNRDFNYPSDNIGEIDPTSSGVTLEMESLILDGGVYDELNGTYSNPDDNVVKKDEAVEMKNYELSMTTDKIETSSYDNAEFESSTLAGQNGDKFVPSSNRRNDWMSDSYQMFPEDGVEDAEETLLDLNVGATSHSDTRVSPNYFFNDDYKDNYFQSGRSLAPSIEKSSEKSVNSEESGSNESKYEPNNVSTEDSSSEETTQALQSKLADALNLKLSKDDQAGLYLSITGTNTSSNEIILHMVLSPSDLKNLAEQLVKESIENHKELTFKETDVKLEWLTKEQLSQIKQMNPSSLVSVSTKCNFTVLADVKSEKHKDKYRSNEQLVSSELSFTDDNALTTESSTDDKETTSSSNEVLDSTTFSYSSSEPTPTQKSETTSEETNTKSQSKSELETSTIKIYEIRPSSDINDRIIESYVTTEGPYTSDKVSSTSESDYLDFYQSDPEQPDSSKVSSEDNTTENDSESATSRISEKPRKKNLPDVEPFLRQLPSTLDEKDVSILRDFLEKHLSEPHHR